MAGGKVLQRQQQPSFLYVAPSQQHGQKLAKQQLQQQCNRAEGLLEAFF